MNYLNQLLGIFRQFTRPIFSHLRNSLPVLLTLGLILIFVGIWTYGTSWSFTGISNENGWDYELAKQVGMGSRIIATVVVLLTLAIIAILKLQLKNARLNKEKNDLEKFFKVLPLNIGSSSLLLVILSSTPKFFPPSRPLFILSKAVFEDPITLPFASMIVCIFAGTTGKRNVRLPNFTCVSHSLRLLTIHLLGINCTSS